jgi:hypothetical protein
MSSVDSAHYLTGRASSDHPPLLIFSVIHEANSKQAEATSLASAMGQG